MPSRSTTQLSQLQMQIAELETSILTKLRSKTSEPIPLPTATNDLHKKFILSAVNNNGVVLYDRRIAGAYTYFWFDAQYAPIKIIAYFYSLHLLLGFFSEKLTQLQNLFNQTPNEKTDTEAQMLINLLKNTLAELPKMPCPALDSEDKKTETDFCGLSTALRDFLNNPPAHVDGSELASPPVETLPAQQPLPLKPPPRKTIEELLGQIEAQKKAHAFFTNGNPLCLFALYHHARHLLENRSPWQHYTCWLGFPRPESTTLKESAKAEEASYQGAGYRKGKLLLEWIAELLASDGSLNQARAITDDYLSRTFLGVKPEQELTLSAHRRSANCFFPSRSARYLSAWEKNLRCAKQEQFKPPQQ